MIPRSLSNCQTEKVTAAADVSAPTLIASTAFSPDWKRELAEASITVEALLDQLDIPVNERHGLLGHKQVNPNFPVRVPASYIALMERGNINDPLLKQVLPLELEQHVAPGFNTDPLAESSSNSATGIIHKYNGRALLLVTQACAIHCRYCFRQHFPYTENTGTKALDEAFNYIEANPDIRELILSGGDPLAASDAFLARIVERANTITQLKRLRIHTRLPIVLPTRITAPLIQTLKAWRGQLVVAIHCNHANELGAAVSNSLHALKDNGTTLLNQSVLLHGVNDHADTLVALSEKLFEQGVIPYYLHQLDKVAGAGHFTVSDEKAKSIIADASTQLPGFLVPKLVRETPGKPAKTLL